MRNKYVALVMFRKSGAHGKTFKAMRRIEKMNIQREYGVNG